MPPKGAAKVKAEGKPPATPEKSKSKPKAEPSTPAKTPTKTPVKTPAKRAANQSVDFTPLEKDISGQVIPIDVSYEGNPQSALRTKGVPYGKLLRLQSGNAFTVTKTIMLTDGEWAGYQAIVIKPAKPFEFMAIPDEARNLVYRYYFASSCVVNGAIVIDGKRSETKEPYAKTYANSSKQRCALLAVSKVIHKEAMPIFAAMPLRFESTGIVTEFFLDNDALDNRVTNIEIKAFQKTTARNALQVLSRFDKLTRLHIDSGMATEGDPIKAAKSFWIDGYKFLQAVAERRADKDKSKAVDILSFHKGAFTLKDETKGKDKGVTKPWPDSMVEEFKEALVGKLTTDALRAWTCICGMTVGTPHRCEDVMSAKQRKQDVESWVHLQHGGAAMLAALPKAEIVT